MDSEGYILYIYEFINYHCTNALELCGRPSIKIPVSVMMPVAHMVEWTYKTFARYGMKIPQLTPSRIRLLSCNRTFSCSRAKDQLGYEPIVSLKVFICDS
jgi:nucleoside-diphosphate-sugar epimerase